MCNDPSVIIAMAANSACLLDCRMTLHCSDIKSLILLLIIMDGSVLHTVECGSPAQLGSNWPQRTAATQQEEERHLSLGRHIPCEDLRSAQSHCIDLPVHWEFAYESPVWAAGAAV